MRRALAILALAALAGCQSMPMKPRAAAPPRCPAGQEAFRTAQIFLGRNATVPTRELLSFIDKEIKPRFADGVTVADGGAKWQGAHNLLIREAAKVVTVVLPPDGDRAGQVEAVRAAYKARFNQDSVILVSAPECVAL